MSGTTDERTVAAEQRRLLEADEKGEPWRRWGPYVAEREWGTVREDYSAEGTPWTSFPFDHARSRAFRWGEDGLAGICDDAQRFCLAFAFWNGVDPILKERLFGLTSEEGNHGEDVKEQWWYLDATPTHSWMRWRYRYPQEPFPYDELVRSSRERRRIVPEFELADTGALDAAWLVTIDFAKASPTDLLARVRVENDGRDSTLHVLPTLWFRNTWSWSGRDELRPRIEADGATLCAWHQALGTLVLTGDGSPRALACENETNVRRLFGAEAGAAFPKDGIGDHVVRGTPTVDPAGVGTKAALHYALPVAAGGTAEIRLRLALGEAAPDLGAAFDLVMHDREREADEFYREVLPSGASRSAGIARRAYAELLWSKQFYFFDVQRWLTGDPAQAPPPTRFSGRNANWRHLVARDVLVVPDAWEYPWFAPIENAFTAVALARVDPGFAKNQLLTVCRETYMRPSGKLPAYEWSFDAVMLPMEAWAALRVFEIDGARDVDFLARIFNKLIVNFAWWANLRDFDGNSLFEGGEVGAELTGASTQPLGDYPVVPLVRSAGDASLWLAVHCLNLLEMALVLARSNRAYEDVAAMLFDRFSWLAEVVDASGRWDEDKGTFASLLQTEDAVVRLGGSLLGLVPSWTVAALDASIPADLPGFSQWLRGLRARQEERFDLIVDERAAQASARVLLRLVPLERLRRLLNGMLDPGEFLSPQGLRSLTARYRDEPLEVSLGGDTRRLEYEPGETTSGIFGGNANYRGPVWPTINYLVIDALRRYHAYVGDSFTVEHPLGSRRQATLAEVADDLSRRILSLFGGDGAAGPEDAAFFEYFHGDTGASLGASHYTGSAAVAALLLS